MGEPGSGTTVTPTQLTQAAGALTASVPTSLTAASAELAQTTGIEYSNFTAVAPMLATAYVAAAQFMDTDLAHKKQLVHQIGENLDATAKTWTAAEHKSTVAGH